MELVFYPDDGLRETARPVNDFTHELKGTMEVMVKVMDSGRGIGLAGPQVGLPLRLFVVRLKDQNPLFFVNPELTATSHEESIFEEGCLSLPGVYAEVVRPAEVSLQAWNTQGKPFRLDADGFLARVIQHEIDHLNGVLFPDHLSPIKRDRLLDQYRKLRKM